MALGPLKQAIPAIVTNQRLRDRSKLVDYWSIDPIIRKAPSPELYVFVYGTSLGSSITIQIGREMSDRFLYYIGQVSFDCARLGYAAQTADKVIAWENHFFRATSFQTRVEAQLDGYIFPVQTNSLFRVTADLLPITPPDFTGLAFLPRIRNKPLNSTIDDQSKSMPQITLDSRSELIENLSHDAIHQVVELAVQSSPIDAVIQMSATVTNESLGSLGGPWAD